MSNKRSKQLSTGMQASPISLSSQLNLTSTSTWEKVHMKMKGHKISRRKSKNWYIVDATLASWQQMNIIRNNGIEKGCRVIDI